MNEAGPRKCGVLLLLDGKQVIPTVSQLNAVERALGPRLAELGLTIVSDIRLAETIATVEVRPLSQDPPRAELILRDVAKNTFLSVRGRNPTTPSIQQADREQARAMSGFSYD